MSQFFVSERSGQQKPPAERNALYSIQHCEMQHHAGRGLNNTSSTPQPPPPPPPQETHTALQLRSPTARTGALVAAAAAAAAAAAVATAHICALYLCSVEIGTIPLRPTTAVHLSPSVPKDEVPATIYRYIYTSTVCTLT